MRLKSLTQEELEEYGILEISKEKTSIEEKKEDLKQINDTQETSQHIIFDGVPRSSSTYSPSINDSMAKQLEKLKPEISKEQTKKTSTISNTFKTGIIERGDIFYMNQTGGMDSNRMLGRRPVIIISNNVGNKYSGIVICIPLTTKRKKPYPTHVELQFSSNKNSIATCEQILTIDKEILGDYIGHVPDDKMHEIETAIKVSLNLDYNESDIPQNVIRQWSDMYRLNLSDDTPIIEKYIKSNKDDEIKETNAENNNNQETKVEVIEKIPEDYAIIKAELEVYKKIYGDMHELLKSAVNRS